MHLVVALALLPACLPVATSGDAPDTAADAADDGDTGTGSDTDDTDDTDDTGDTDDTEDTGPDLEPVGDGVLLFTGYGGGNWYGTGEELADLYAREGVRARLDDTLPSDLADTYGVLVLLNPVETLGGEVLAAATELVRRGGRVVVSVEWDDYGSPDNANLVFDAVGSTIVARVGDDDGSSVLDVPSAPPLTDGVSELYVWGVADIVPGRGVALGETDEGRTPIVWEALDRGDVVAIGDGTMLGYSLSERDNERFFLNLAEPLGR